MSGSLLQVRLRDLVRPDGVGAVWCDDREILQRIFVTVRDEHWREVAPTDSNSEIDDTSDIATLSAHHVSDCVGFEWTGTFHLSEDRQSLRFQFVGRILRDMRACRVGLVVLHPVESMIGSSVIAVGPQTGHEITPTNVIAPQPVLNGVPQAMTEPFHRLKIERADFGRLELTFEGDLFELEDQRNWGDTSFKTYCTPLRSGFPRELKAGTLIKHSVEARFTQPDARTRISLIPYRTGVFPRLGREWNRLLPAPGTQQASQSNWAYVYFDAGVLGDLSELREVLDQASSPLSLGLEVGTGTLPSEAIDLLAAQRTKVAQLLVYGPGTSLPSIEAISRCHQELKKSAPGWEPTLLAATRGYFVELNRRTPFNLPVSGTAFPLTATVHSSEREMIAGNVSAIADMASTGFRLTGVSQLSITPLALYYPRSRMTQPFPAEMVGPWLVATLIHAALGGIDEVTLANDILAALSNLESGGMEFISHLTGLADKEVASFPGGLPRSLHAVKFTTATENEPQVLTSNLSSSGVEISLAWWGFRPRIAINALTGQPIAHNDSGLVVPGYSVILLQT